MIAVPNLLFISALLFAVGALTRKLFAVYVTGIILLVAWQVTQQVIGHLDKLSLGALTDPFALTTTEVLIRYWSVAEKNTGLVPFSGVMLQNRLLWSVIAIALFAVVALVFRLRLQHAGGRPKRAGAKIARVAAPPIPAVALRYDAASWLRALAAESTFHFRSIVREAPYLAISLICVVNLMVGMWFTTHPSDSARWPVTSLLAPNIAGNLFIFTIILATLYGGELVWRERQLRIDQMQDAMPVPIWVTFGGKLLAVFLAIGLLSVVACGAGLAMQLAQGYARVQLGLYLQILVFVMLPTALAIVALAMGVHAVVNQKFVGHLIMIAYWVLLQVLTTLGFDHRLYQIGRTPDFVYSDMARWGPYLPRIFTIQLYSIATAVTVAALGLLVLVRGTDAGLTARRHFAAVRWRHGGGLATAAFAAMAVVLGAFFFYNANTLNAYTEVRSSERRVKTWETTYKSLQSLPHPRIVSVTLRHDYFPERRASAWNGGLVAVNRDPRPVDTLYVSLPTTGAYPSSAFEAASNSGLALDSLVFNRDATLLKDDPINGVRLYRFAKPLAPGENAVRPIRRPVRAARLSERCVQQRRRLQRLVHEQLIHSELRLSRRARAGRRLTPARATSFRQSRG